MDLSILVTVDTEGDDEWAFRRRPALENIPFMREFEAAVERADFTLLEFLLGFLSQPYQDPSEQAAYHLPPLPSAQPYRTFCGT